MTNGKGKQGWTKDVYRAKDQPKLPRVNIYALMVTAVDNGTSKAIIGKLSKECSPATEQQQLEKSGQGSQN